MSIYSKVRKPYHNFDRFLKFFKDTLLGLNKPNSWTVDIEFLYLFIILKKFNREKKERPPVIMTSLNIDEFSHFIKEYNEIPPESDKPVLIILRVIGHTIFLSLEKIIGVVHIALFDSTDYENSLIHILGILNLHQIKTNFYIYNSKVGTIQFGSSGCSWFALENCFTLSKNLIDFFKLSKQSIDPSELVLEYDLNAFENHNIYI